MEMFTQLVKEISENAWLLGGVFVASMVVSTAMVVTVLILMPPDYFVGKAPRPFLEGRPLWVRVLATVLKNGLAWVLLAFGLVLSVPGVPGQGLLTIMVGLLLADFPGKRSLERRLVRVHAVHSVANKIRARFNKPPLLGLD
jgi:hypothetical protein